MRVLLGISGGIAAYKAAELARLLQQQGSRVQAILTPAAQQFITPLTMAALTGQRPITDLFASGSAEDMLASSVEHIRVAQEHDILVVVPATADVLAKFAHGLADDFLSTSYLAFTGPVVLAPAMNSRMWDHPATKANLAVLRSRGHVIIEPGEGLLACGTSGPGRLAELEEIATAVQSAAAPRQDLAGETVLITAGPTQEPLDPVRFISNRSSGKMGYMLAEAAVRRGARVILVSGPVSLSAPANVQLIPVHTAEEMRRAVLNYLDESSIIIKAAAVADYCLREVPKQKLKKMQARLTLELDPTPDILAELGQLKGDRLLVGFAAETQNLESEARRKLETKHCDLIVANLVSDRAIGFESDDNEVLLVPRAGDSVRIAKAPKRQIADAILDRVLPLRLTLMARA